MSGASCAKTVEGVDSRPLLSDWRGAPVRPVPEVRQDVGMNWDPVVRARRELRGLLILCPLILIAGLLQIALGVLRLLGDDAEFATWISVMLGAVFLGNGIYHAFRIPKVRARLLELQREADEPQPAPE